MKTKSPSVLLYSEAFYPAIGGAEIFVLRLAKTLIQMNIQVRILTYQLQKDAKRNELVQNISVNRIPYPNLRFVGEVVGICRLLLFLWKRRSEFQIIQIHGVGFAAAALVVVGKLIGKKLIVHVTGSETYRYIYRSKWRRLLVWSAIRRAGLFVAASGEMRKFLVAHHIPASKIIVIPRGLEIPQNGRAEKIDQLTQNQLKQKIAIFIGRLVIEKGLEDLLHAWQLVCQQRDDCRLWILGEGGLKRELVALTRRLNIDSRVNFWGSVEEVFNCLKHADLFVMSSISEGLSNALLEAMAVGLPVVVTAVGGAVDIIRDEENGLLVPLRNPPRLAAALLRLFDNPALAAKLGQAARATICEKYSIETVAKQHVALYNRLNREVHHDTTQIRLGFNSGV